MRLMWVVTALSMIALLRAQEHPAPPASAAPHENAAEPPAPPLVESSSITKHSIQINGKTLAYTATAGTLILKKDNKPWASIFYVAYTLEGVAEASKRPITFAFNGGPGSSSVWLHLGALGPKRVLMGPENLPHRIAEPRQAASFTAAKIARVLMQHGWENGPGHVIAHDKIGICRT